MGSVRDGDPSWTGKRTILAVKYAEVGLKVTRWNKIFSLLSLFLAFQFIPANGQSDQFPKELEEVALSHGMNPLYDFSNIDPRFKGSTYVYGFAEGNKSDSAVFWTWKKVNGKKQYYLVLMNKTSLPCNCPMIIKFWHTEWHAPMELSLYRNEKVKLSWFTCLKDKKMKIPKGYKAERAFIRIGNDTLDTLFYCYEKTWWVLMRD